MLCSIKSSSNWLCRLRTSRGFPSETGLDLEQFLNPSPDLVARSDVSPVPAAGENASGIPASESGAEVPPSRSGAELDRRPNHDWFVLMTNVLSELFNMGGGAQIGPRLRPSRAPRKQPNPRTCAASASASVGDSCAAGGGNGHHIAAMSPSSAENSVAAAGRDSGKDGGCGGGEEAPVGGTEEEISQLGEEDWELGSFSRTMVTVIDTSAPVWRSEKVIFRKGDVWKICDRKGNSSIGSRKRRRLHQSDKLGGANATGKEDKLQLPNEGPAQNNNNKYIEEAVDIARQIPEKRLAFARSLRKPATGDSCILHIKCIPTSGRKDLLKRRLKDKC